MGVRSSRSWCPGLRDAVCRVTGLLVVGGGRVLSGGCACSHCPRCLCCRQLQQQQQQAEMEGGGGREEIYEAGQVTLPQVNVHL